jgi:hypothetical protein
MTRTLFDISQPIVMTWKAGLGAHPWRFSIWDGCKWVKFSDYAHWQKSKRAAESQARRIVKRMKARAE